MRFSPIRCWSTLLALSPLLATLASGARTNRTIDDEYGDEVTGEKLVYTPENRWTQGSTCKGCLYHPTTAYNGTWHDTTQHPNDKEVPTVTAHFTGTAVYVYNFFASYYIDSANLTVTYVTFEIDGARVGEFFRDQILKLQLDKSVPIYVNDGLANKPHTLVMRVPPGPDGKAWSFVLFDRIVYTFDDEAESPLPPDAPEDGGEVKSKSHVGAIVGGAVGGAALLLLLGFGFWFFRRRRRATEFGQYDRHDILPSSDDDPTYPVPTAHDGAYQDAAAPAAPQTVDLSAQANARPSFVSQRSFEDAPSVAPTSSQPAAYAQAAPPPLNAQGSTQPTLYPPALASYAVPLASYAQSSSQSAPSHPSTSSPSLPPPPPSTGGSSARQAALVVVPPLPPPGKSGFPRDTKAPFVMSPPATAGTWNAEDPEIGGAQPRLSAMEAHEQRIRELEQRLEAVELPPPGYDEVAREHRA